MKNKTIEKELEEFLSQPILARIATVTRDCKPHIAPVWFLYENGIIYTTTGKDSVKARNIRNNPHITLSIDTTEGGLNNRGVIMAEKAKIIENESSSDVAKKIFTKYLGSIDRPHAKELLKLPRMVISLRPDKVISWGFAEGG